MVEDQFVIPAGAVVRGVVDKATASSKGDERAMLALAFNELERRLYFRKCSRSKCSSRSRTLER